MSKRMTRFALLSCASLTLLGLAAPALAQSAGGTIRIVTSFTVDDLNPAVGTASNFLYDYGANETMMRLLDDGINHPWLLEALENTGPNTWVLTLREGITFQNGKSLDVEALLAAIERQRALAPVSRSALPEGSTFEITGEREITLTTPVPFANVPAVLSQDTIFPVYDVEAVEAVGEDWEQLAGAGIYTGPFILETLSPEGMTLSRYEDYWQGMPALETVDVRFVTDAMARVLAVQNGEADIAMYPPSAAAEVIARTPGMHYVLGGLPAGGFIAFTNVSTAPMDDANVRLAVQYGINYEEIASEVFQGLREVPTGLFASAFEWALAGQHYDPEHAAMLLDEAGWAPGPDGIRVKDGERLEIVALIYPQQPDLPPMTNAMQFQLRQIGIDFQARSVDDINGALLGDDVDWDIGFLSNATVSWGSPDQFFQRYIASSGDMNFAGYANDEVDALISGILATVAPEERLPLLTRVQEILIEEDPYAIMTSVSSGRAVVNDRFRDYVPGTHNIFVTWETAPSEAQ